MGMIALLPSLVVFFLLVYIFGWLVAILVWGGLAILAWAAYANELETEGKRETTFRGMQLFSQYGTNIFERTLSIPLTESVMAHVDELMQQLLDHVTQDLQSALALLRTDISKVAVQAQDRPSDRRVFVRLRARTIRGSQLAFFFLPVLTGKHIVAHLQIYQRGHHTWLDFLIFLLTSPVTIWIWGLSWLQGRFSIIVSLSSMNMNAFDKLDLATAYGAAYQAFWMSVYNFLSQKGLLSEVVEQSITYNMVIGPQVNIESSQNVTVGRIRNMIGLSSK